MTGIDSPRLVVIVDDDDLFRRSMERLIRSSGFRVESFGSAEAFLERADVEQAACVVLDMKLPGMSGFDLQRRLIASDRRVPIVFVSAHDDVAMQANVLRAGAIAFLRKPFDDRVLIDAIGRAVERQGKREDV